MTKMNAVVKYPCKEVTTKFGKRLTVIFQTDSGEQITKWGMAGDRFMPTLKRNQKVTLDKEGNKIIVIPINEDITEQMLTKESVNETIKNTLLSKTQWLAKHYEDCDKMVRASITGYKSEDSIRAITTTVFLQSIRG